MALIICYKCGKEYSTRHAACTSCGQLTAAQVAPIAVAGLRGLKAPAMFIILTFAALLWLISRPTTTEPASAVKAGVDRRSSDEICRSTSVECKNWTALAQGCALNMRRREAGYMGKFPRNYCSEAETYREEVTGIKNSSAPGAFSF